MTASIVTSCHCENYGAELQACALVRVLHALGCEARLIDFERTPPASSVRRKLFARAIHLRLRRHFWRGLSELALLFMRRFLNRFRSTPRTVYSLTEQRRKRFEAFWETFEPHTPRLASSQIALLESEAFIAGSDQIWNWTKTGDLSPYLLHGVPSSRRRLAYAASLSDDELPNSYRSQYADGLRNFQFLSMRERQGIRLLQPLSDLPIQFVLDPTLLLSRDQWSRIWSDSIRFDEPYVFSYSLNESSRYFELACRYARAHRMKVVNVTCGAKRTERAEVLDVFDAGPQEFLYLLAHAAFVFTNSFHGTIFSINFNVPFLSVLNPASTTNSRVLSIVGELGLADRVVMDDEPDKARSVWDREIDFSGVNRRRTSLVRESMEFLASSLGIDGEHARLADRDCR